MQGNEKHLAFDVMNLLTKHNTRGGISRYTKDKIV